MKKKTFITKKRTLHNYRSNKKQKKSLKGKGILINMNGGVVVGNILDVVSHGGPTNVATALCPLGTAS